ncbi:MULTISPECIES: hypothetical protein [Acinetobacter]|uniref:hypothetical protein n=1 Tax=Acinetobacter TaxID=469 RepID=UPI0015D25525|nr:MULTISPECIES: hypothetical protein [Acinetobacter]
MIIVAIIDVILAISIPLYQGYVAKSPIAAALAKLNGAKTQYELIINGVSDSSSNNFTIENMFF